MMERACPEKPKALKLPRIDKTQSHSSLIAPGLGRGEGGAEAWEAVTFFYQTVNNNESRGGGGARAGVANFRLTPPLDDTPGASDRHPP